MSVKRPAVVPLICALGIVASPRCAGNSRALIDAALERIAERGIETERVFLDRLHLEPCSGCGQCRTRGRCVIEDDGPWLFARIAEARIILVSAPVYFSTVPAQLKILIDRCQPLWLRQKGRRRSVPGKTAGFICVSAARREDYFDRSCVMMRILCNMIGARYTGELRVPGMETSDAVRRVRRGSLSRAAALGEALAKRVVTGKNA